MPVEELPAALRPSDLCSRRASLKGGRSRERRLIERTPFGFVGLFAGAV